MTTGRSNIREAGLREPHAYHSNLPPNHIDPEDGVSFTAKYAARKARAFLKLARSLHLKESMFLLRHDDESRAEDVDAVMDDDDDDDGDAVMEDSDEGNGGETKQDSSEEETSLFKLGKKCSRLYSQWNGLASWKFEPLSDRELAEIVLRILRLVCATVHIKEWIDKDGLLQRQVRLSYDHVGYIRTAQSWMPDEWKDVGVQTGEDGAEAMKDSDSLSKEINTNLFEGSFALPSPAREALLSVALQILSEKGPMKAMSNIAIFPRHESTADRATLVIDWRSLMRLLLRTAPYLDECRVGPVPMDSSSRQSTVFKRTVNLIRSARRYFDQGVGPPRDSGEGGQVTDITSRAIWNEVRSDLLNRTHSNACFRALIILYLLLPSRCTTEFYREVVPDYLKAWSLVDRCADADYLWLTLLCRARKYMADSSFLPFWATVRRRILTKSAFWLQIPFGGSSKDKSFPNAAMPRSRSFPMRLKSFVGTPSSYQEGIDFVGKVSKLLVMTMGRNDTDEPKATEGLSDSTAELLRFFHFVTPYYNPSNTGSWTFPLGALLHYLSFEFCHRLGMAAGMRELRSTDAELADTVCQMEPYLALLELPPHEIVAVLDALLPLCQQALYSKNGYVSRAGESALHYLTHMDAIHVAPPFLDFTMQALDISSVNMAHQAPVALSVLGRLVQPSLRRDPRILLQRLPSILRLSLLGVDSNDQQKTVRTLILYRSVASWIPIGDGTQLLTSGNSSGKTPGIAHHGTNLIQHVVAATSSDAYKAALNALPESSLLYQDPSLSSFLGDEHSATAKKEALEEVALVMADWSLEFLDRMYDLFRAEGAQEKRGKSVGVASRHSSADAEQTRNVSRIVKECLGQVFSAMDSKAHLAAIRSVCRFLSEETLPFAAKNVASLCAAAAAARAETESSLPSVEQRSVSPGLDALVPILTEELSQQSTKTATFRIRCLAGAVRYAGRTVLNHRTAVVGALQFALSKKEDKHLYKTGCKLLRHLLFSQCETYPLSSSCRPRVANPTTEDDATYSPLGKSAQLERDGVQWHVPVGEQIDFVVDILRNVVMKDLPRLGSPVAGDSETSDLSFCRDVLEWRRALRLVRYALRGSVSLLLDNAPETESDGSGGAEPEVLDPQELAVNALLVRSSPVSQEFLKGLRQKLCAFVACAMAVVAVTSDTDEEEITKDDNGDSDALDLTKKEMLAPLIGDGEIGKIVEKLLQGGSSATDSAGAQTSNENGQGSAESSELKTALVSLVSAKLPGVDVGKILEASNGSVMSLLQDVVDVSSGGEAGKKKSSVQTVASRGIGFDKKVCKELLDVAYILLARRGALFRGQDAKAILDSKEQMLSDFTIAAETDLVASFSERCGRSPATSFYYDGEDGGKTLPRCLVVVGVDLFFQSIQRNSSYEIPRRLGRLQRALNAETRRVKGPFLALAADLKEKCTLQSAGDTPAFQAYEELIDGICALSCHTNSGTRSRAIGTFDHALTRFGWAVHDRVPRLMSAVNLSDSEKAWVFGVPSCEVLVGRVNAQGKRKRLAEVLKGVWSLASSSRAVKHMMGTESGRFSLIRGLSQAMQTMTLLPTEEITKVLSYVQSMLGQFRPKFYLLPLTATMENKEHNECLRYLLNILTSESASGKAEGDKDVQSLTWRNRLAVGWLLTTYVDERTFLMREDIIPSLWKLCFDLIEKETGQPLQRVALGLLGRLIFLCGGSHDENTGRWVDEVYPRFSLDTARDPTIPRDHFALESSLRLLSTALVFDHEEDKSVGGGHDAQWSSGVEDILKDSASNMAPRNLFPFQRSGKATGLFKLRHAQLVQGVLGLLEGAAMMTSAECLLNVGKELAASPPSEDQRNQHCTAVEIFAGVARCLLLRCGEDPMESAKVWNDVLLPSLDDILGKIPITSFGVLSDSVRFAIHRQSPQSYYSFVESLVKKIEDTIWQHSEDESMEADAEDSKQPSSSSGRDKSTDGFSAQSKLLYLVGTVLIVIEFDYISGMDWYTGLVVGDRPNFTAKSIGTEDYESTWNLLTQRLLPCLLGAAGHPYENCREHVAACLFRIVQIQRKLRCVLSDEVLQGSAESLDAGAKIVKDLASYEHREGYSFKEQRHSLITARKFMVYCNHLGEYVNEFSSYVIPLIPLAFEALKTSEEEETLGEGSELEEKELAANRMLEAEMVKGYRYFLSETSGSCQLTYEGGQVDGTRILDALEKASTHGVWQVRQAAGHFVRCFQGGQKFILDPSQTARATEIAARLLADERREVSSAAMATVTGILASMPLDVVDERVSTYIAIANKSVKKKKKTSRNGTSNSGEVTEAEKAAAEEKENARIKQQQTSVFFLCAAILARPYDTPPYVPRALAAVSKHSFERNAPLNVRETVKMCCADFKRTHMSDNWELHRKQFNQEQLDALEDVVSSPHYYA